MATPQWAMVFEPVATPVVEQVWGSNDGGPFPPWAPGSAVATAEIQVVGLAGADVPIPALSGLGLAALAAALATGGFLAVRRA